MRDIAIGDRSTVFFDRPGRECKAQYRDRPRDGARSRGRFRWLVVGGPKDSVNAWADCSTDLLGLGCYLVYILQPRPLGAKDRTSYLIVTPGHSSTFQCELSSRYTGGASCAAIPSGTNSSCISPTVFGIRTQVRPLVAVASRTPFRQTAHAASPSVCQHPVGRRTVASPSACLRAARQPSRVQDRLEERTLTCRPGEDRSRRRGDFAQSHGVRRRVSTAQHLFQRNGRGLARCRATSDRVEGRVRLGIAKTFFLPPRYVTAHCKYGL